MLKDYEVEYNIRGTLNIKASSPQEAEEISKEDLEYELSTLYLDNARIEIEQVKETN